ncbi:MAG: DNA repair protein RecO [Rhizomicrobium sp.]
MEWADEAVVLGMRAHGEHAVVLDVLTRAHGRHAGLVRGGASRKVRADLQPGNSLQVVWRARLEEHLGSFAAEPIRARSGALIEVRERLVGLNAFTAMAHAALPEREPHEGVFEAGLVLLDAMIAADFMDWMALYVRWEIGLLTELGFGLDLSCCAATGVSEDLTHVSPKSGRAVSAAAAAPYRDRLLKLPAFLLGAQNAVSAGDVQAGLALTEHFLVHRVFYPHGQEVPGARLQLQELVTRLDSV